MKKKIGIIGVGLMGFGMGKNFLERGYELYIWNRTKRRVCR